ncbi:MAG: BatD family protein [Candidatus Omnitrophota bacterium]
MMAKIFRLKGTRHQTCLISVLILLSACVSAAQAQGLKVKAAVDKDTVTIGDKVRYTVTVSAPKGIEVEFSAIEGNIGDFTIRDSEFSKKSFFGKVTLMRRYVLETLKPGKHTIPPMAVKYRKKDETEWSEIKTEEIPVGVESVLAKYPDASDIRDIKGPVGLPGRYTFLVYLLMAAIAAAFARWAFLYMRKQRLAKTAEIAAKFPYEIAYERLRLLRAKGLPGKGRIEEYYVELSNIVRCYLEERFNLRAPEMTTEEFLAGLKEEEKLARAHKNLLKEFLSHCDLVKFARYGPTPSERDLSFESAKKLVDKTREV